ncbi:uncharacterized protein SAMN02910358_01290 [Lachnospiraceae bacterium XBB1006]|nr:uncharacterized protein SAMN02910358_01290 [Lachnospiraceae bacterium XBB1006]
MAFDVSYLLLQVTQQCNLCCPYCFYSEEYPNTRSATNKKMNIETAKIESRTLFYLFIFSR